MILPTTYGAVIVLLMLSMLSWGSWANTQKLTGKWRFELFYYDFSFGVVIAALVAAYTFGTLGDELSFADNLFVTGKRNMAFALVGGGVFNLANILLVAAIAIAGMSVAFPIAIGLALVIGTVWNYILDPQGNKYLLFGGLVLVAAAIIVDGMAYAANSAAKKLEEELNPVLTAAGKPKRPRQGSGAKGIVVSLISGVLMGSFYPLVRMGMGDGPDSGGLGPYAVAVIFSIGVLATTFVYNLYFLNLPIVGKAIPMSQYFLGTRRQHLLGLGGGALWCVGAVTNFVAAAAPRQIQAGPAVSYALGQGATLISVLWGLLVWKEFAGAAPRVRLLIAVMLALFVCGLGMISLAPVFAV
jgi:glucose uptake protein